MVENICSNVFQKRKYYDEEFIADVNKLWIVTCKISSFTFDTIHQKSWHVANTIKKYLSEQVKS